VLNNAAVRVQPHTRARILGAAAELGYRPNSNARGLRLARSNTIGLILPNFANPVYAQIINAVARRAEEQGYTVLMHANLSGGDRHERIVTENRVDGLLMAGALGSSTGLERVEALGVPTVLVNRAVPGAPASVTLDDTRASQLAVEYLAALGHRKIAHIAGPPSADTAARRREGYELALERLDLDRAAELVVPGTYDEAGGAAAMESLLAAGTDATAVLAANVTLALGALSAAHRRGVEVPGQLSVIAIHDTSFAAYSVPALTTVAMPLDELGSAAIDMLADRIEGAPGSVRVITEPPPRLVERESTARAPRR
jgi:LacI family transcriptional regulator